MNRHAILVLGMHRGGTSALAGALVRLGVEAPKTLMPPDVANELGYWESARLNEYHDRLLRSLGTSWDAWTPLREWDQTPQAIGLSQELSELIAAEFGSSAWFVVKDPRMCRFVQFWIRNLHAEGIGAGSIIIVRNPREVALSLAARDGFAPEWSSLMWLRHMLDAEESTRSVPRSIISYRDLLRDWRAALGQVAADLRIDWPLARGTPEHPVTDFLRSTLRHHVVDGADTDLSPPLSDWITPALFAFEQLMYGAGSGRADAYRTLDEIKVQLDRAALVFGSPDEALRHAERERAESIEADRSRLGNEAAALSTDRSRLRNEAAALATDRDLLRQHAAALETELGCLRGHAAAVQAERDRVSQYADSVAQERDALRIQAAQTEVRRVGLEQTRNELERGMRHLEDQLASTTHHLNAILASGSWRMTAPIRAALRLARRVVGNGVREGTRPGG